VQTRREMDLHAAREAPAADRETKKKKESPAAESTGPKKLSYKQQRELAELENEIPNLENQLKSLEYQMIAAATDYLKLNELSQQHAKLKTKLDENMIRWEELAIRAEKS